MFKNYLILNSHKQLFINMRSFPLLDEVHRVRIEDKWRMLFAEFYKKVT